MSKANGKVRPAWMGGTTAEEEPVTTAPTTEDQGEEVHGEQAYEESYPEQTGKDVEQAPVKSEPSLEPEPERGHDSPSPSRPAARGRHRTRATSSRPLTRKTWRRRAATGGAARRRSVAPTGDTERS